MDFGRALTEVKCDGALMRRALLVDFEDGRAGGHIQIGPVKRYENEPSVDDPILDMAILCEAVCVMIRVCHKNGVKDQAESMRDCIKHLNLGYADEAMKTRTVIGKNSGVNDDRTDSNS